MSNRFDEYIWAYPTYELHFAGHAGLYNPAQAARVRSLIRRYAILVLQRRYVRNSTIPSTHPTISVVGIIDRGGGRAVNLVARSIPVHRIGIGQECE